MIKSVPLIQTNNEPDAIKFNARLVHLEQTFGDKQLCLVIEKRLFLCEKNFDFFEKLIKANLFKGEKKLTAKIQIDFNNKPKAKQILESFGFEINDKD